MPVYPTQHESSLQAKHYVEILSTKTAGLFIKSSYQNQDAQQSSILLSKSREHLNYCKAAFCNSLFYSLHCPLLSETANNHFPTSRVGSSLISAFNKHRLLTLYSAFGLRSSGA